MNFLGKSSSSKDEGEKEDDDDNNSAFGGDTTLLAVHQSIVELEGRRHLQQGPHRSTARADSRYLDDLEDDDDCYDDEEETAAWLNDKEFLKKCGMTCSQFHKLLHVTKDNNVFQSDGRGHPQRPVVNQSLVASKALGAERSNASNPDLRDVLGAGGGTNSACVRQACNASQSH